MLLLRHKQRQKEKHTQLHTPHTKLTKVDLHSAAGGNLTPISEPGDLWPGEAVYSR